MFVNALIAAVLLLATVALFSLADLISTIDVRAGADEIVMRWRLRGVRAFGNPTMYARHVAAYRAATPAQRRQTWAYPRRVRVTVGEPGRVVGAVLDGELV